MSVSVSMSVDVSAMQYAGCAFFFFFPSRSLSQDIFGGGDILR